jgi:hypothetical protein
MPRGRKPYEEEAEEEEDRPVGPCKDCQYFDVDRDEEDITDETLAACIHPDLEEYDLTVSGDSGCNLFEAYEADEEDDEDDVEEEEEDEDEEY